MIFIIIIIISIIIIAIVNSLCLVWTVQTVGSGGFQFQARH